MDEPRFTLADSRVAIVGLGLMGGSLGLALRGAKACREVLGVDANPETLSTAHRLGAVDRPTDWESAIHADVLILATPPRVILAQLEQLSRFTSLHFSTRFARDLRASGAMALHPAPLRFGGRGVSRPTVVLDLGSTKTQIVAMMQTLPACFEPIGGHPMCGKEVSGLAQAEADLYRDQVFILTPTAHTTVRALQLALELIGAIGARPVIMREGAERHDFLAALVSHLPYTVSAALVRAALAVERPAEETDGLLWSIAASGFRDTSRLAASDLTMMTDILLTNRAAVLDALRLYRGELDALERAIESGEAETLLHALEPAQKKRRDLFK
jgi:prephenate dehydrogenase